MSDITCKNAIIERKKEIYCKKADGICGNQYFCEMKGRFKLTEASLRCPLKRKDEENG